MSLTGYSCGCITCDCTRATGRSARPDGTTDVRKAGTMVSTTAFAPGHQFHAPHPARGQPTKWSSATSSLAGRGASVRSMFLLTNRI